MTSFNISTSPSKNQIAPADRQSINFVYRNTDGQVAIEWVTDDRNQKDGDKTALALFEIGLNHVSDVPASIANFRQVAK